VPVAQRVEVTDQVGGGPDVVGPDVWEPVSELITPADVDQWEAIVEQPPDLADRGVAADEDGSVGELEPAQRTLPTGRGFRPRQAGEQQVVAFGGGFLLDPDQKRVVGVPQVHREGGCEGVQTNEEASSCSKPARGGISDVA
jgi:hypothetical protein